jgi:hypothetical protein
VDETKQMCVFEYLRLAKTPSRLPGRYHLPKATSKKDTEVSALREVYVSTRKTNIHNFVLFRARIVKIPSLSSSDILRIRNDSFLPICIAGNQ